MREIILDPVNISLTIAIFIVGFLAFCNYGSKIQGSQRLADGFTFLIFLGIPYLQMPGFMFLHPVTLIQPNLEIWKTIAQIGVYIISVFTLRIWFSDFSKTILFLLKRPLPTIFLSFVILSSLWSETPIYSFLSSIIFLALTLVGVHISRKYSLEKIFFFLRWSTTTIAILSVWFAIFMPSIGIHGKGWKGVMVHPNRLGLLLALNISLWIIFLLYSKKFFVPFINISLSLLIIGFTNSATSQVATFSLLLIPAIIYLARKLNYKKSFIFAIFSVTFIIILAVFIINNIDSILALFGKNATLTGRGPLWILVWRFIQERPLFGYGYQGFWQPWRGEYEPAYIIRYAFHWEADHSHNGFLDLMLDLGFIGAALFLIWFLRDLISSISFALRKPNFKYSVPLTILFFVVVSNLSVSDLISVKHIWFYYVLASMKVDS
jgi:exopolysaccharide production protein ExoQ